jgi:nicotinate-nucleotide--dimethylbenzimidazole phosphoribosyltransferase
MLDERRGVEPETPFDLTGVPQPDEIARAEAVRLHATLIKPAASLGRLEELGVWVAACQGQSPPRPFTRPRVVVFAGDHGIAAKGVSAYPPEVTAQLVGSMLTGGAAINVLAASAGASLRVVDMAVRGETAAPVAEFKVREGSGSIDVEDALTDTEVRAAISAGMRVADAEVDGGADLLIPGDLGVGNSTPSAVLVAALTGSEPVAVVGRGSGIDDATWMRKATAIRDALRRARPVLHDPIALLRTAGGADLAAITGFLVQAAVRRTPVLLDGLAVGAAALVAEELAPGASSWWVAAQSSGDPAHTLVLEHLDLEPVLELGVRLGEGTGAVAALPLLFMATRVLAEMSTHEQAGVTGPLTPPPAD